MTQDLDSDNYYMKIVYPEEHQISDSFNVGGGVFEAFRYVAQDFKWHLSYYYAYRLQADNSLYYGDIIFALCTAGHNCFNILTLDYKHKCQLGAADSYY